MVEVAKKIMYIILILGVNLYICSWLSVKLYARAGLSRGFTRTKLRGFSYPVLKLCSYLGKDQKVTFWDFLIFVFSFMLWAFIPVTSSLVIVDIDHNIFAVVGIYIILVATLFSQATVTEYGHIFSNIIKKLAGLLTFLLPFLLCIASIVLINKTFSLKEIVNFQYQYYNIIYQPVGFLVAFISVFFHMKLLKITDVTELSFTENKNTETKGFSRFVIRLSGYFMIFFLILLMILLYLGGWKELYFLRGEIFLGIKFYLVFILLLIANRATPRLDNYTYLANINIRFLLPVAAVNFIATLAFFILRNNYGMI